MGSSVPATRGRDQYMFSALTVAVVPAWGSLLLSLPWPHTGSLQGVLSGMDTNIMQRFSLLFIDVFFGSLICFSFFRQMCIGFNGSRCSLPRVAGEHFSTSDGSHHCSQGEHMFYSFWP